MEKIDQYLPLYLGQKVKITDGRIVTLTGVYTKAVPYYDCNIVQVYHDDQINWLESDEVKLILRPISSMTEEEKLELYGMGFTCNNGMQILHPTEWNAFKPTQFQWLLSKGFDIFGLKEKGLCLYPEEL